MSVRNRIDHGMTFLSGMALGGLLMYVLDENSGGRRRALARDKLVRLGHDARWYADKQLRNARNHLVGTVAEYRSKVRDLRGVDDDQLVARVAAQIGHVVSHPGALGITAEDGHVTVVGPILRNEVDKLKTRLNHTRGVRSCDLQLDIHDSAENVPDLQGQSRWQRRERQERTA